MYKAMDISPQVFKYTVSFIIEITVNYNHITLLVCAYLASYFVFLLKYDNMLRTLVPMGRLCRAEDVAKAVLFLTSKRASYLTGVSIPIDGGFCNQKLFMLKRK